MLLGFPLFAAVLLGAAHAAPCDIIYNAANTPCVASHSTVRGLLDSYRDGLYQVTRVSDQTTLDIAPLCRGRCRTGRFLPRNHVHHYDQSGKGNHLTAAPAGGAKNSPDSPAVADRFAITVNGHKAYGVWVDAGVGYRNDKTTGIATGDDAEAIYMVADGTHYNSGCCFDYGNAETNNKDDGAATMEAIYIGNSTMWGYGEGTGPWVMADLEDGLFGCEASKYCSNTPTVQYPFLVAMLKGRSGGTFALKQGNAQSGTLQTTYDGARPSGYTTIKKQGAIILGIGGDNSNWAVGSFYEGVLVSGDPTEDVDNQVQANIVAAGYGVESGSGHSYTFSFGSQSGSGGSVTVPN